MSRPKVHVPGPDGVAYCNNAGCDYHFTSDLCSVCERRVAGLIAPPTKLQQVGLRWLVDNARTEVEWESDRQRDAAVAAIEWLQSLAGRR